MTLAVYAGTFDPITAGHLSVVRAAARLFGHVRILVAVNPEKRTLFSREERVEMIREVTGRFPNVSVDATEGFVVEYAREIDASFLVRGIRGATDAVFETELSQGNRLLAPEISTILLPAEPGLSEVSSSALKEMARRGEDISRFCAPSVAARLISRVQETSAA